MILYSLKKLLDLTEVKLLNGYKSIDMKAKYLLFFALISTMAVSGYATEPLIIKTYNQTQQKVVRIDGVNIQRTISVKAGEKVVIEGANNIITIKGNCDEIEIDGTNNQIQSNNVRKIEIEGANNLVKANEVVVVEIEGANNKVNYTSSPNRTGLAKSNVEGVNNSVKKIK